VRSKQLAGTRVWAALVVVLVLAAGCGGKGSSAQPSSSPPAPRLQSTGKISIIEPTPGKVVNGGSMHVKLTVEGATILDNPNVVQPKPDEGHIHLSLDGKVVSMTYGTEQDIAVTPGRHLLEAEFVAGDHLPFSPRVAQKTTFTAE
jgi:hypothetical protein